MRMSSSMFSWVSSYHLLLLVVGVSLVLLGAWSQLSSDRDEKSSYSSGGIDEQSIPRVITPSKKSSDPPVLAYSISGSRGDSNRILRLLKAIYHPRNQYLLHLDGDASDQERMALATKVHSERAFRAFGNVNVVGRSYGTNRRGASAVAAVLHAAALLLKLNADWDWFTALTVFDYPLLTQDDILYAFTTVPRNLNFVQYANNTSKEEWQRANQIVVDTSLYLENNGPVFRSSGRRDTPDAFKIYRGSPRMMLSRGFIEHCVMGWDNLPRKLLMYYTNSVDPLESYFHTILCNSADFQNTTVNNDLRRHNIDHQSGASSQLNRKEYYQRLISGGAIFASPFKAGDSTLDEIDKTILNRQPDMLVPGKWCRNQEGLMSNSTSSQQHFCSTGNDVDSVEPGGNGMRFKKFLAEELTAGKRLLSTQCQH